MKKFYDEKSEISKKLKELKKKVAGRNKRKKELESMKIKNERVNHILDFESFKHEVEAGVEKDNLMWL